MHVLYQFCAYVCTLVPDCGHVCTGRCGTAYSHMRDSGWVVLCGLYFYPNAVCQKDICFVLDYSKTIDDAEFEQIRNITSDIVMRVDDVGQTVRFCILVYGYGAVLEAHLNDSYSKTALLAEIAAIKRLRQFRGTRTINALREAANVFMSQGRPDAKHIIILITDGRATDDKGQRLSRARTLLNQKEIGISGIGVGNKINGTELERIVGDPTKVILDFSSDDLEHVVEEIEACTCP